MRFAILAVTALATVSCVASPAAAAGRKQMSDRQMLALDPLTRIEQRCNAQAMVVVGREHAGMRPDELVAYAYEDPKIEGTTIAATGAAVRSKGTWFHLSYVCTLTANGLDVVSFRHSLGAAVPRSDWSAHYLVGP